MLRRLVEYGLLHPQFTLTLLSLALRLSSSLLLLLVPFILPTFPTDATQLDVPLSPYLQPFIRWDAVHFVHVALFGYEREEKTAAFGPGLTRGVMRRGGEVVAWLRRKEKVGEDEVVLAGMAGTTAATTLAALVLYRLTKTLFPSAPPTFPLLTSTLFLLAPSRPTLHAAPYTEPFAALFTFAGMHFFSLALPSSERGKGGRWSRVGGELAAAGCWAAGSAFRAQGALLGAGSFGWRYILQRPYRSGRLSPLKLLTSLPPFLLLSTLSALPFLLFQRHIHQLYCSPLALESLSPSAGASSAFHAKAEWDVFSLPRPRPWCTLGVGMSYGWIQREYWNIRPFAYWTLLQLPNFALAAPVLAVAFSASYTFYKHNLPCVLSSTFPFLFSPVSPSVLTPVHHHARPFSRPLNREQATLLTPFVHLSTALSLLLLTTAHVQIALRMCVVDPVIWWRGAELVLPLLPPREEKERAREKEQDDGKWGRRWGRYSVGWGTLSLVLWAVWLPPA